MLLSLVVRGSAALDNVFVGVTSSTHTDQRGLQVRAGGGSTLCENRCSSYADLATGVVLLPCKQAAAARYEVC
jgi:hypothetical protein